MRRLLALLFVANALVGATSCTQWSATTKEVPPQSFLEALELIHAFNGSGSDLKRAAVRSEALQTSHPKSGYSQALQAELLSTWELSQEGEPVELRQHIIGLADEAIRLNPTLAQAHVAKARAFVRASMYPPAEAELSAALAIDPTSSGAYFLKGEILRRNRQIAEAHAVYQKFIDSTASASRKANGYGWIAQMYSDEAWKNKKDRPELLKKARAAYEQELALEPDGPWRNVNFAIFLNGYEADFDAAERYAMRALQLMEFRMARYQLAAARYQRLWAASYVVEGAASKDRVAAIASSTQVSLDDAIEFSPFGALVQKRLSLLRERSQAPIK